MPMKTINPSLEAIKQFTQEAVDNKAIVMVNVPIQPEGTGKNYHNRLNLMKF